MPLLKRLSTIAAKVEGTNGTAESLTASQGVYNAYDIEIQGNIDFEEREAQGSFDMLSQVPGARKGTMSFKTDVAWDGADVPAWASVLLPACGYVDSTQVFYPTSEAPGSNVKTATIGVFINGLYKLLAGAVGTFKIVMPAGRRCTMEWEFQGVWQAPTDSALVTPTYPTDIPLRNAGSTITYNSVAQVVENVTFDAGNEIKVLESAATASGLSHGVVVSRKPMINLNPEAQLVATSDKYGFWLAAGEYAFSCSVPNITGNGSIAIAAPKAQVINIQEGERDKIATDEVTLSCNKNAANTDQDVSITFTDDA